MPIPADSSHKPQSALPKPPLFPTGQIVATPGALELLQRHGLTPWPFITRHVEGDWGDLDAQDAALNRAAVNDGSRILSAYVVGDVSSRRVMLFIGRLFSFGMRSLSISR